jgi:hypothetical protein
MKKIVIEVSGGVVEYFHEKGIEVSLFDWDNLRESENVGELDAHIADAKKLPWLRTGADIVKRLESIKAALEVRG